MKDKATLKNSDFGPKSRRVWEFYRRHIVDMSRIKFSHATQRLGQKTIFQGSHKRLIRLLTGFLSTLFCLSLFSLVNTATADEDVWLVSIDNGIFRETRNGSMWQAERTKRLRSEDKVKLYLEQLNAGQYNDWRLPTKSELYRFIEIFDWKKNGAVRTRIEGDHWLTSKSGKITAGEWELDDLCGPERIYYTKKSGYVRAIRP